MTKELKKENLLTSWKEIAAYLDCDERTCVRWEKKYRLPVHRIDEISKATVFAYKDELDQWLEKFTVSKAFAQEEAAGKRSRRRIFYFLLAFLVILAVRFFLLPRMTSNPQPADFRIEKAHLLVLNEKGKEMWRFDSGVENLMGEREYRDHFQFKRKFLDRRLLPHLIIKDLNHDGQVEVLFSIQTQDEDGEGKLFCFNHDGRVLWEFQAGREIKFGERVYSPDYRIQGVDVCDLDGDGNFEIITMAVQRFYFPTQLAVLDADGRILGEYWNAGQFCDLAFIDLNEDGEMEILAAGINNEYGKGCLVAFDWNEVKGSSPQGKDFACQGCAKGKEKHYILFPLTEVDLLEKPVGAIDLINSLGNKQISVKTQLSDVYYIFDYNLELQDVQLSHTFKHKYRLAHLEGKIERELNSDYEKRLAQGLLYFNGHTWVSSPLGSDLPRFPHVPNVKAQKFYMID